MNVAELLEILQTIPNKNLELSAHNGILIVGKDMRIAINEDADKAMRDYMYSFLLP